MNSCKYCGKEIPEGRKFCNSSCAAKYNNKHRQPRKPWTEEQRERFSLKRRIENDSHREQKFYTEDGCRVLERRCKYCGKVLDLEKGERRTCQEHKNLQKRLPSLRKLKCTEGLPDLEAYSTGIEFLIQEYTLKKKSITQIAKETGIWEVSIKELLNIQGIHLRSLAEANKVGLEAGRKRLVSCPKYLHGRHVTWQGIGVYYRSSYELEYAKQLDEQKVPYEVESKRIRYFSSIDQQEHVAIPDFYLPETNELVEIKSRYTYNEQNMKDKFKAYRDSGYNPILILDKKQMAL